MHDDTSGIDIVGGVRLAITDGLGEGAKLRTARMVELIPGVGMRFLGKPTKDQFARLLLSLRSVRDSYDLYLADARREGVAFFGEEEIKSLFVQLEFDYADEMKAVRIGRFTVDDRKISRLTSEHYYVLGGMDDPAGRTFWEQQASAHGLTANELKKSIVAGRVVRQAEIDEKQGSNSGFITVQAISHDFELWTRKVGGEDKIFALAVEDQRQLLRELRGPGELYLKLQARLGAGGAAA